MIGGFFGGFLCGLVGWFAGWSIGWLVGSLAGLYVGELDGGRVVGPSKVWLVSRWVIGQSIILPVVE